MRVLFVFRSLKGATVKEISSLARHFTNFPRWPDLVVVVAFLLSHLAVLAQLRLPEAEGTQPHQLPDVTQQERDVGHVVHPLKYLNTRFKAA